ncbi:hypothetical protein DYB32_006246 [Aphanomyces invadans]|uniref:Uncharacterized protein n=1 Tax=Aphanomyces invadans TaxID=157072 RepID=A0A418AS86_9STRA|nr:hypothetical protein DYB32_006246 [Aphanomyces invadans]
MAAAETIQRATKEFDREQREVDLARLDSSAKLTPHAQLDDSLQHPLRSISAKAASTRSAPNQPSIVKSVVGTLVTWLTFASVLFALYTVTGAVLSALALQQRGGLLVELEQLDMSIARTFHDLQTKEVALESAMADLTSSMAAQRHDAHEAMDALRESSAAWNKSMRDDMEAFKVEFMAMLLKPVDAA